MEKLLNSKDDKDLDEDLSEKVKLTLPEIKLEEVKHLDVENADEDANHKFNKKKKFTFVRNSKESPQKPHITIPRIPDLKKNVTAPILNINLNHRLHGNLLPVLEIANLKYLPKFNPSRAGMQKFENPHNSSLFDENTSYSSSFSSDQELSPDARRLARYQSQNVLKVKTVPIVSTRQDSKKDKVEERRTKVASKRITKGKRKRKRRHAKRLAITLGKFGVGRRKS